MEKSITANRVEDILSVFGSFDQNLHIIEKELDVHITDRDEELKISGEALMGESGPIGFEKVEKTARSIAALAEKGIEVGVVVGGGNIIRGRDAGQHDRNRRDHMGMLATAINALALQDAFEGLGKKAAVLSAVDMDRFCDSFSSRKAKELLSQKVIVIFACGSGCPFFSTDTAAALRAAEIGADALLLAKNVDAIYSADPKQDPGAKKYSDYFITFKNERNICKSFFKW